MKTDSFAVKTEQHYAGIARQYDKADMLFFYACGFVGGLCGYMATWAVMNL